jgi:hypothetical protein
MIRFNVKHVAIGLFMGFAVAVTSLGTALLAPTPSFAASGDKCNAGTIVAFPHWYDGLCNSSDGTIKSPKDAQGGIGGFLTTIAKNIITMLLYVVGYVSIVFIIWGGFKYMISGDNSSGTAAARKTILNAVIGLVLSIMSVAIVNVIGGAIK